MSIIIFLISIALLILVHEFGHFIVAKKLGIRVDEFALGFPPKLLSKKWGGTLYTLNAIPFGGFVKIFGENSHTEVISEEDKSTSFFYKPKWVQSLVLVAGVAMNVIFAWFLISLLLLQSDGIMAFWEAAKLTAFITKETIFGLGTFLWNIISFKADFSQVSGVVGIASIFKEAEIIGFAQVVYLVAVISINLAVINLVPLPALDGGRLLFVGIEAIIRRPINPKIVRTLSLISFLFLLVLMVFVTAHDILKLI